MAASWRQIPAGCCNRLAAIWVQFVCDWLAKLQRNSLRLAPSRMHFHALDPDPYQNVMDSPGFWIRIRIRINLSCWIRIRIRIQIADPDPGKKKLPQKIEKSTEVSSFEVLNVLF